MLVHDRPAQKSVGERRPTLAHDASLATSKGSSSARAGGLNVPQRGSSASKSSSDANVSSDAVLMLPGDCARAAAPPGLAKRGEAACTSENGDMTRGDGEATWERVGGVGGVSGSTRRELRGVVYEERARDWDMPRLGEVWCDEMGERSDMWGEAMESDTGVGSWGDITCGNAGEGSRAYDRGRVRPRAGCAGLLSIERVPPDSAEGDGGTEVSKRTWVGGVVSMCGGSLSDWRAGAVSRIDRTSCCGRTHLAHCPRRSPLTEARSVERPPPVVCGPSWERLEFDRPAAGDLSACVIARSIARPRRPIAAATAVDGRSEDRSCALTPTPSSFEEALCPSLELRSDVGLVYELHERGV